MDRLRVDIRPLVDGSVPSDEEMLEKAVEAGWSDDPGTGHAILVEDERGAPGYEVLNPLPVAPPIGWTPTPPLEELIRDHVRREFVQLQGEDELDDIIDAEDFDVPDELPDLSTIYEFVGMEPQAPEARVKEASPEELAKAEADRLDLVDRQRLLNRRAREEKLRRQRERDELLYGDEKSPPGGGLVEEEKGA